MPISINGTGSITGLSAGGLPDASITADDIASNAVTTAKVNDAAVTPAKLSGGQSGSAPAYAVRSWVCFNGTGTIAIRASGNVSSLVDNGVGLYQVNMTTAMPDSDYAVSLSKQTPVGTNISDTGIHNNIVSIVQLVAPTTSSYSVMISQADCAYVTCIVVR